MRDVSAEVDNWLISFDVRIVYNYVELRSFVRFGPELGTPPSVIIPSIVYLIY